MGTRTTTTTTLPAGTDPTAAASGADGRWKRCANRPWVRCQADADCEAPGWCTANQKCQPGSHPRGFFRDFTDRACQGPGDCVPPGVCRPLLLKVEWQGAAEVPTAIYDLDWDPDERTNLLKLPGSEEYFTVDEPDDPATLTNKFTACLGHFLAQVGPRHEWDNSGSSTNPRCPDELRDWAVTGP